jgi:hypothetical protein
MGASLSLAPPIQPITADELRESLEIAEPKLRAPASPAERLEGLELLGKQLGRATFFQFVRNDEDAAHADRLVAPAAPLVPLLVSIVASTEEDDGATIASACIALTNLAGSPSCRPSLFEAGAAEALLRVLGSAAAGVDAKRRAAAALNTLCADPSCLRGGDPAATRFSSQPEICRPDEAGVARALAAGALPALLGCITTAYTEPEQERITFECMWALATIAASKAPATRAELARHAAPLARKLLELIECRPFHLEGIEGVMMPITIYTGGQVFALDLLAASVDGQPELASAFMALPGAARALVRRLVMCCDADTCGPAPDESARHALATMEALTSRGSWRGAAAARDALLRAGLLPALRRCLDFRRLHGGGGLERQQVAEAAQSITDDHSDDSMPHAALMSAWVQGSAAQGAIRDRAYVALSALALLEQFAAAGGEPTRQLLLQGGALGVVEVAASLAGDMGETVQTMVAGVRQLLLQGSGGEQPPAGAEGAPAAGAVGAGPSSGSPAEGRCRSFSRSCCAACGKTAEQAGQAKLQMCAGCGGGGPRYCSKECQRADWRLGHRRECCRREQG